MTFCWRWLMKAMEMAAAALIRPRPRLRLLMAAKTIDTTAEL